MHRIRACGLVVCLVAGSACLPTGSAPTARHDTAQREIISVEAMDQWYATVAVLPCIREQPDLMKIVTGLSDERHLVWLTYRRVERGKQVVMRDVQVLYSAWHLSMLDQCIATATEGLSFHDPDVTRRRGHPATGDNRYELGLPANLLSQLSREFDASQ